MKIFDQTGFLAIAPDGPFGGGLFLKTGETVLQLIDTNGDDVIDSAKTIVESGVTGNGLVFDAEGILYVQRGSSGTPHSIYKIIPEDDLIPAVEGLPYSYDVEATDPDPGDVLTYSLEIAPDGMSVDPATGLVQWTPVNAQVGVNEARVKVEDLAGFFDTQSWSIAVTGLNRAPQIVSSPVTEMSVNSTYAYDVDAVDPDSGDDLRYWLDAVPM